MKLLQCGCGRYFLAGEALCPACGAPLSMARYVTDPKTKKLRAIVGISIVVLLLLTVILMAVLQLGPFHPRIRLPEISVTELTEADTFDPPTEEEQATVSEYLAAAKRGAYLNMSYAEKKTAAQLVSLIDVMARGGDIQPEALAEAIGQDGDAFRAEVDEMLRQAKEAEAAAQAEPDTASAPIRVSYSQLASQTTEGRLIQLAAEDTQAVAAEEEITLPSREQHGSWVQLNKKRDNNDRVCPNCSYLNEPTADICEKCGCDLARHLMYAEIEESETVPEETKEEDIPIYTAQLLNNIANELMLHGYADIPFYLACLANMEAPQDTDVLCTIAELLKTSGHYKDALAIANYGLRFYPNDEDTLYVAGMCAIKLDDPDLAAGYFNRALKITGGGGPGNQGMMLVSIQRQDFGSAFLYMIEGARDAFTHSIWEVYQAMKLRPDYAEISANAFEQYSLYELMKFERNRTAFDPTLDTVGQQITLGKLVWPTTLQDWRYSCFSMFDKCAAYGEQLIGALGEEIGEVGEALDILLTSKDFRDMAQRFASSSFMPKEKTDAEEQISYEQEMFWLSILGEYVDYQAKKIEEKHLETIGNLAIDEIMEVIEMYATKNAERMMTGYDERFDDPYYLMNHMYSYMLWMVNAMTVMQETIIDNHSAALLTEEESAKVVRLINNEINTCAKDINKSYEEVRILMEEYWLYANAILGLIADDTIYNEYRAEQRYRVATTPSVYILETAMVSFTVAYVNDGIPMLGKPADGGSVVGVVPSFPKLPVSGKGATPEALMYGDIYVPNIGKVTQQVIGMTQEEIEEALELQRMLTYQDNYDRMIAEMTPEQRVKFEAYRADPNCVNRTIILQPYNASGGPVIGFYSEKIPYATGTAEMKIGPGDKPIAKLSYDSNGNMGISIKDMAGIETTPQDVTMFIGGSKGLDILDKFKLESEGVSVAPDIKAEASARIFATYNYRTGKFTSGGAKAGASARIGGMAGLEGELSHNVVTGLSQSDISTIWFGRKFGIKTLWSWKWP